MINEAVKINKIIELFTKWFHQFTITNSEFSWIFSTNQNESCIFIYFCFLVKTIWLQLKNLWQFRIGNSLNLEVSIYLDYNELIRSNYESTNSVFTNISQLKKESCCFGPIRNFWVLRIQKNNQISVIKIGENRIHGFVVWSDELVISFSRKRRLHVFTKFQLRIPNVFLRMV